MLPNAACEPLARNRTDKHQHLVLVVLLLLAVLLSLRYAPPFQLVGRDSGVFLYGGRTILNGGLPYQDFWDHKPPLVYVIDAIGLGLGHGRWGIWLLETAMLAGACWLFFGMLAQQLGLVASATATAFLVSAARNPLVYEGGNLTEGFALYLILIIFGLAVSRTPRLRLWFAGGCLGGVVLFLKESCIAVPVALAISLGIMAIPRRPPRYRKALAAYVAGGIVATVLVVAALLVLGVLRGFWLSNVVFSKLYIGMLSTGMSILTLRRLLATTHRLGLLVPVGVAWIAAATLLIRSRARSAIPGEALLAVTIVFSIPVELFFIALPGRFSGHYFLTLLASVAAGIGIALHIFMEALKGVWTPSSVFKRAAVPVVLGAISVLAPAASRGGLRAAASWAIHPKVAMNDPATASYLRSRPPSEYLLIFGMETRWNFLSDRRAPTRYTYITPLLYPAFSQRSRLNEYLLALREHPDSLLIDTFGLIDPSASPSFTDPRKRAYFGKLIHDLPPGWLIKFRHVIHCGWRMDRILPEGWVAYVRRDRIADMDIGKGASHAQPREVFFGKASQ